MDAEKQGRQTAPKFAKAFGAARGWEVGAQGVLTARPRPGCSAWATAAGRGVCDASSLLNTQKRSKGSPPRCFPASEFEEGDALLARPVSGRREHWVPVALGAGLS